MSTETAFAADILCGADEIATFLYGDAKERRKIYYLVETSRLPVFRMGSTICMRRSTLLEWVKAQEQNTSRNAEIARSHAISALAQGDDVSKNR